MGMSIGLRRMETLTHLMAATRLMVEAAEMGAIHGYRHVGYFHEVWPLARGFPLGGIC
jgi:hypothetical protein